MKNNEIKNKIYEDIYKLYFELFKICFLKNKDFKKTHLIKEIKKNISRKKTILSKL